MVINGYSLVIGILIGISITVIIGLIAINREPKIEPKQVNLLEDQSSDDIDSLKNEISKLWGAFSDIDKKCEKFFTQYKKALIDLRQRVGIDLGDDDPRMHLRLNAYNRPIVYIVRFIRSDYYGPDDYLDVFANEDDAIKFVQKLKDSNSGVSDVSVSPRIVYLDKDKTLDNVD